MLQIHTETVGKSFTRVPDYMDFFAFFQFIYKVSVRMVSAFLIRYHAVWKNLTALPCEIICIIAQVIHSFIQGQEHNVYFIFFGSDIPVSTAVTLICPESASSTFAPQTILQVFGALCSISSPACVTSPSVISSPPIICKSTP